MFFNLQSVFFFKLVCHISFPAVIEKVDELFQAERHETNVHCAVVKLIFHGLREKCAH